MHKTFRYSYFQEIKEHLHSQPTVQVIIFLTWLEAEASPAWMGLQDSRQVSWSSLGGSTRIWNPWSTMDEEEWTAFLGMNWSCWLLSSLSPSELSSTGSESIMSITLNVHVIKLPALNITWYACYATTGLHCNTLLAATTFILSPLQSRVYGACRALLHPQKYFRTLCLSNESTLPLYDVLNSVRRKDVERWTLISARW